MPKILQIEFDPNTCTFSKKELDELKTIGELLVYLLGKLTPEELYKLFEIKSNICFIIEISPETELLSRAYGQTLYIQNPRLMIFDVNEYMRF